MPILSGGTSQRPALALSTTSADDVLPIILLLGFIVVAFRVFAWNQVKALLARSWLTQPGMVELASVEERRGRYKNFYIAHLDYSYSVNGEYYSGHLERLFVLESSADKFIAAMKGQMVFIRSHPNRPERSALLKQDQPGGWPA